MLAIDASTVVLSTALSGAVAFVVSGLMRTLVDWAQGRWREHVALRDLLDNGDHVVIGGVGTQLGPAAASSRVRVAVGPAVRFATDVPLDPDIVHRWVAATLPPLAVDRHHSDPSALVRYVNGDSTVEVHANGLVIVLLPVRDEITGSGYDGDHQLDLGSVIEAVVPVIVSLVGGAYESLFVGRLRTPRLDWRFDVSIDLNGPVQGQRSGLVFNGPEPERSTPGQTTPLAGSAGFGGPRMRNRSIQDSPVDIGLDFLADLISRSGYSGLSDTLADIREVVGAKATEAASSTIE